MTLLIISFIAGVLTVLSPCVLPLLPVIVGGSLSGGTSFKRALTVTVSLGISVLAFTFLLKVSTLFINVPQSFWSIVSGGLVIVVGLVTLFPVLWDRIPFMAAWSRKSNMTMSSGFTKQSFWGDVVVGAALGPVFSTCSPTYFIVLASVLPVSLTLGVVDIAAYVVGLCLSLLLISFVGQRVMAMLGVAANPSGWFKRILGILFIAVGLAIITGADKALEAPLYNLFDSTKIEQRLLEDQSAANAAPLAGAGEGTGAVMANTTEGEPVATSTTDGSVIHADQSNQTVAPLSFLSAAQKAARYSKAPELVSPDAYLNTNGEPITISQFKGRKVVLIDFWTYSCINCMRTIPYVNAWYEKYKDEGLEIIGVHTPEFSFEHVKQNVADAIARLGIKYPVVLDNEYATWNAFQNQYWPRKYLIDIDGYIVYDHAGEGDYDGAEQAIQKALQERADRLNMPSGSVSGGTADVSASSGGIVGSPETYFGAARNEYLGNGTPGTVGVASFVIPDIHTTNRLYLGGSWNITNEYAEANEDETVVRFTYNARDVYFVAASDSPATVTVLRDGAPVGTFGGADVDQKTSTATIHEDRLYKLIHDTTLGTHTLELHIHGEGLQAYTFTFG